METFGSSYDVGLPKVSVKTEDSRQVETVEDVKGIPDS